MKLHKAFINLIIILFIYLVLINFLNGSHIYNFMWQTDNIFQDLIMPVKWLECHKAGQDIFISDDCAGGTFAYGPIFLTLPINESLKIFYLNYLPYISIFLFVAFVVLSIKKKNLLSYVLIFFCIFNPSTLLLLQRMNIDIIIFLLLIFLSFNTKIYFLNWTLIFFLTFSKIYPIVSGIIVFFEEKSRPLKKVFIIIFGVCLIGFLYLIFNIDTYVDFFNGLSANKAGYHFLFSLNAIPKIAKYVFSFNYIFFLVIIYLSFFYLVNRLNKKFTFINSYKIDFYSFNFKIFLLGSVISIISFIFFSNYFHREIFLIMTIPFVLSLFYIKKNRFLKYFLFFVIFKYFYLFVYSYINIHDSLTYENDQRVFSNYFILSIFIKSFIDFIQMSILTSLALSTVRSFLINSKIY